MGECAFLPASHKPAGRKSPGGSPCRRDLHGHQKLASVVCVAEFLAEKIPTIQPDAKGHIAIRHPDSSRCSKGSTGQVHYFEFRHAATNIEFGDLPVGRERESGKQQWATQKRDIVFILSCDSYTPLQLGCLTSWNGSPAHPFFRGHAYTEEDDAVLPDCAALTCLSNDAKVLHTG